MADAFFIVNLSVVVRIIFILVEVLVNAYPSERHRSKWTEEQGRSLTLCLVWLILSVCVL